MNEFKKVSRSLLARGLCLRTVSHIVQRFLFFSSSRRQEPPADPAARQAPCGWWPGSRGTAGSPSPHAPARSDKPSPSDCPSRKCDFPRLSFLGGLHYKRQPHVPFGFSKSAALLAGGEKQEHIDRLISFHILISIINKTSVLFRGRGSTGDSVPRFIPGFPGHTSPSERTHAWTGAGEEAAVRQFSPISVFFTLTNILSSHLLTLWD